MSIPVTTWDGRPTADLAAEWKVPRVEAWARVGSTNDRALELAREGTPVGTVVVADEQTAGRGRRGSTWTSPAGTGVWMTMVLDPKTALPALPLLVGVACAEAIESIAPGVRVAVKWPNDLFIGDRKLGGILVEATPRAVVAGIGINLRAPTGGFPEPLASLATALDAHAPAGDRSVLAGAIIRAVHDRLGRADRTADTIESVRGRDWLLDRRVDTDRSGPGIARGIDATGALLLERPDGSTVSVGSGSVRIRA